MIIIENKDNPLVPIVFATAKPKRDARGKVSMVSVCMATDVCCCRGCCYTMAFLFYCCPLWPEVDQKVKTSSVVHWRGWGVLLVLALRVTENLFPFSMARGDSSRLRLLDTPTTEYKNNFNNNLIW